MNPIYLDTARLLVQIAPQVFSSGMFALKGGTAINLFVRDMPRLSVDLDLVFVDHQLPRDEALRAIQKTIRETATKLQKRGLQTRVAAAGEAGETKLFVRRDRIEVKVEVNSVMRGTLYPTRSMPLSPLAQEQLLAELELPLLAVDELYGSKLVAAMDRQHPRDLFDVAQLLAADGITASARRCFVAYLACHNRPIHEVLFPVQRDIAQEYERTFRGMTTEPVTLPTLLQAREQMIAELHAGLDTDERHFLVSLARNEPDWSALGFEHFQHLPGARWKQHNLQQLARRSSKKLHAQADELGRLLDTL